MPRAFRESQRNAHTEKAKPMKKPKQITITLTYPSRYLRFNCNHGLITMPGHKLKDGDHITVCNIGYCRLNLCQDHLDEHIQEHTLNKLAGNY